MSLLVLLKGHPGGPTLFDVGVTISDTLTPRAVRPRSMTSTGVTITDSLVKNTTGAVTTRSLTDTGVTISDSVATGAVTRTAVDAYADGASATFGASTVSATRYSIFTDTFDTYTPPADETESYYGRLPLQEAQPKLSETAVEPGSYTSVNCTWHGQVIDPERGSFILVRAGSDLEDRIGRRVRITVRGKRAKNVVGFVHGVAPLDERDDISVPRRLFMELSLPGFDRAPVIVETLKK